MLAEEKEKWARPKSQKINKKEVVCRKQGGTGGGRGGIREKISDDYRRHGVQKRVVGNADKS